MQKRKKMQINVNFIFTLIKSLINFLIYYVPMIKKRNFDLKRKTLISKKRKIE